MNDTWEWDGGYWTQMQDVGPSPRSLTALAFDSERGRTVLFGGQGAAGVLGDTWEWDGSDWTQVQDVGPSARSGQAMSFDSDQQRTLLFGGILPGGVTADTWQYDGTAWTQAEDTGPPARQSHGMVYASDRKRTVLFGGANESQAALSDTWEWDTTKWTHVQDIGPARESMAMAFTGSSAALFGGYNGAQGNPAALFGDTWGWDGKYWVERQDMGPQVRQLHAMAFDSARSRLVLFGGTAVLERDSQLGDTWEATDSGAGSGVVLVTLAVSLENLVVPEGGVVSGEMIFSAPAPAGLVQVQMSVDNPAIGTLVVDGTLDVAGPPWSIPIQSGATSLTFKSAKVVAGLGTVTFTATLGGVTKTASVNTGPPGLP